ncbi:MAG TPA: ornithine carbamoyltransferase [Thermomicrobiales bacterium]|nr:ornithine carbamoyltransferase [Thermomicrobiales bacterium]
MDLAAYTQQSQDQQTDSVVSETPAQSTGHAPAAPLHAVAPTQPSYDSMLAPASDRIISLGGPGTQWLPTFTVSARLRQRDLLSEVDLTPDEITEVLDTAFRLKDMLHSGQPHSYLAGKTLAMLFEHPSTRTRLSLQAGMAQLGGQAIVLNQNDLQISRGETIGDTAEIFSRYVDGIAARVASHDTLLALAESASVPVYNALSDRYHPMQSLCDMMSLREQFGALAGLKLAYVGDGANNMAASLMLAGSALGVSVTVATPAAYQPDPDVVTRAKWLANSTGATATVTDDPWAAAKDADAIYTDVHVSLNQKDGATRAVTLAPFKVTEEMMNAARPAAVFMHCLPMHRGVEVDGDVADGPRSIIFDQAENRLHLQKAVLLQTMC